MHPIPYRRSLQGKSRRVVTCAVQTLFLSFVLLSWMRKTRSWVGVWNTHTHVHGASRSHASCDVHPWLGRNPFNEQASLIRGGSAVVPICVISAFCAFVERQREEEVQRTTIDTREGKYLFSARERFNPLR